MSNPSVDTPIDTSADAVQQYVPQWSQQFDSKIVAFMEETVGGGWVRFEALEALAAERDALRDQYTYIGKDGKSVLARDLEEERDQLRKDVDVARYVCSRVKSLADQDMSGSMINHHVRQLRLISAMAGKALSTPIGDIEDD